MNFKDNVQKGRIGEDIAKEYLQKLGYKIIDMKNKRSYVKARTAACALALFTAVKSG